ncbi:MAG: hypothetical protein KDA84_15735, partial [Planctomycetaceae bacterium]|nr:hypothetical protein [Planctomycetaceae bacterium]
MSEYDRRQFAKHLLAQLAKASGAVVVISHALSNESSAEEPTATEKPSPEERAIQIAQESDSSERDGEEKLGAFRRGGF